MATNYESIIECVKLVYVDGILARIVIQSGPSMIWESLRNDITLYEDDLDLNLFLLTEIITE
jgi:hypothetical protein